MGLHLKELEESFETKVGGGEEIPLERICISFCCFLCASPAWHCFLLMYTIRALHILGIFGLHTCWRPGMLLWAQVDIFCHYSAQIFKTGYLYSYPLAEEYGFTPSSPFLKVSHLVRIDILCRAVGRLLTLGRAQSLSPFPLALKTMEIEAQVPLGLANTLVWSACLIDYFPLSEFPLPLQHLKVVFFLKTWCPEFLFVLCRIITQALLWTLVTKAWNWDFMEMSTYSWSSQVTSCMYNIYF